MIYSNKIKAKLVHFFSFLALGISLTLFVSLASADAKGQIKNSKPIKEQSVSSVSINSASAKELSKKLVGVGVSRANAIVAYREKNGNFKKIEDLLKVKGIGKRMIEKNKMNISL